MMHPPPCFIPHDMLTLLQMLSTCVHDTCTPLRFRLSLNCKHKERAVIPARSVLPFCSQKFCYMTQGYKMLSMCTPNSTDAGRIRCVYLTHSTFYLQTPSKGKERKRKETKQKRHARPVSRLELCDAGIGSVWSFLIKMGRWSGGGNRPSK